MGPVMVALPVAGAAAVGARGLVAVGGCRWLSVDGGRLACLPVGSGEVGGRRSVDGGRFGAGSAVGAPALPGGRLAPCPSRAPRVPLVCPCSAWCSWAAAGWDATPGGRATRPGAAAGPQASSAAGAARGAGADSAPRTRPGGKPTLPAARCAALGRALAPRARDPRGVRASASARHRQHRVSGRADRAARSCITSLSTIAGLRTRRGALGVRRR